MIHSWPRAIVHVDGDAFFASCEQVIHPELKGRPVATGSERGIISSASYEAKKFGVARGVTPWDAKKMCPGLVFVQSDYEVYNVFAQKMFAIMRRFTPVVEEYSIDEAFADITGFRRVYRCGYEEIGRRIKEAIEGELRIGVSVGVSVSKVLAKVASKFRKPSGLVFIPGRDIETYLAQVPVEKIWGVGGRTAAYMQAHGIRTALDFAQKPEGFVKEFFAKPQHELWMELRGHSVHPVVDVPKTSYASISKTHTFTPPSSDRAFVYAQVVRNLERACEKARRYALVTMEVSVQLKTQKFQVVALNMKLRRASAFPTDMMPEVGKLFQQLFSTGVLYRATGVALHGLFSEASGAQLSLFDTPAALEKNQRIFATIDTITDKMGKGTIHLGGSMLARSRDYQPSRFEQQKF